MKLLDQTPKLYTPEKAEKVTRELSENDDWKYKAVHSLNGLSYIEIYDEDNMLVGSW